GSDVPLGAVPNVVDRVRFNGPLFAAIAALTSPRVAAAVALFAGLTVAAWGRWRLEPTDPAAWAWPMATAVTFAPVIYPWYLLSVTPFLFTVATIPLLAWTISALSVYEVWDLSRHGGRRRPPAGAGARRGRSCCSGSACSLRPRPSSSGNDGVVDVGRLTARELR